MEELNFFHLNVYLTKQYNSINKNYKKIETLSLADTFFFFYILLLNIHTRYHSLNYIAKCIVVGRNIKIQNKPVLGRTFLIVLFE